MTEKKKSFILYLDMRSTLAKLSDESYGRLMRAVYDYAAEGIIPEFTDMCEDLMFSVIKTTLDRDEEKWTETRLARSEAGKKGGAPAGNNNASRNKQPEQLKTTQNNLNNQNNQNNQKQAKQAKQAVNVSVNVSDSVSESVSESVSVSANASESIILSHTQESREMFGSERNIPLTTSEYRKLCDEFTKARTDAEIERLSLSCGRTELDIRSCFALLVKRLTD